MATRLCASLEDLSRVPEEVRGSLLAGRVDAEHPLAHVGEARVEPVSALEFCCDLLDAAVIVDLLRSWDREAGRSATRAYVVDESRAGAAWRKVPDRVQLTVLLPSGEVLLNRAALDARDDSTVEFRELTGDCEVLVRRR